MRWRTGARDPGTGQYIKFGGPVFDTVKDRDEFLASKRAELARAKPARRGVDSLSFDDVVDRYIAAHRNTGMIGEAHALELRTVMTQMAGRDQPDGHQWRTVADITVDAVLAWQQRKTRGRNKPLSLLKGVLRWAAMPPLRQPIDHTVLLVQKVQEGGRATPPLLLAEEVQALLHRAAIFGDSAALQVEHIATFGCRPSDTCRLPVKHWDRRQRLLTHTDMKNGEWVRHPVHDAFAKRLDALTAGRGPDDPIYRHPTGKPWARNKRGKWQQFLDWYWDNVSSHVLGNRAQWGVYCLKDYAISVMDHLGIDDATKQLFTGHTDTESYDHYRATNTRQASLAVDRLAGSVTAREAGSPVLPGDARGIANLLAGAHGHITDDTGTSTGNGHGRGHTRLRHH